MAVNKLCVWAECNDGHTTLAGINVDDLAVSEICKWAGVIPWCLPRIRRCDKKRATNGSS